MRHVLIVAVAVLIVYCGAYQPGPVSPRCLKCICDVESNCKPIGCEPDPEEEACGFYQLHKPYFQDAQPYAKIGKDFKSCASNRACSERAVQGYMSRYATRSQLGHEPDCEDFARIHNGGPNGYSYSSTVKYWNKVKDCLRK